MSQPPVRIVAARDTDLIKHLDKICFPDDVLLKRHLHGGIWWFAKQDGKVVGYCCVFRVPKEEDEEQPWWAIRSGVLEEARGQGIQQKLLRVRVNHVRRSGADRINTYVSNQNIASLRSCIKEGFVPFRVDEDFMYMEKFF